MGKTALATENFAGTGALDGNWTDLQGGTAGTVTRSSDQGTASADGAAGLAIRTGETYANDQYAQVVIKGIADGASYVGVIVRGSDPGATFEAYTLTTDGVAGVGHTAIQEWANGTPTSLLDISSDTWAVNDLLELRVEGTTLGAYKNGVLVDSTTDATLASGDPGVRVFDDGGLADDWEGGDIAGPSIPIVMRHYLNMGNN